jgi:hypothetical protein
MPEASSDYPKWWNFDADADGPKVVGMFLEAGKGHTVQGPRVFVILDVEGQGPRTVWLHHEVLQQAFRRELHRRPDKQFKVGERIEIEQLGMKDGQAGTSYMNYRVRFLDGPEVSQVDVFGPPPDEPQQPQQARQPGETAGGSDGFDDDTPFQRN